jgi:hypothetical protein
MAVDLDIYHIHPDLVAMAGPGAVIYYNPPAAADLVYSTILVPVLDNGRASPDSMEISD